MVRIFAALVFALGFAHAGLAQTTSPQTIEIEHAWARASGGKTGVAYFTIINKGTIDDRMISASTPVAQKAEPHTTVDDHGIMKMRPVHGIVVKAGGRAELKPGGLHLMLIGLTAPLKEGQSFPLTLTFEKAGNIDATATVEKAGAMSRRDMPGMDDGMPGAMKNMPGMK